MKSCLYSPAERKYNTVYMVHFRGSRRSYGAVSNQLLITIGLLVLVVGLAGLSAWLFAQYTAQKTDVDSKIAVAAAAAKKQQAEEDAIKTEELLKLPSRDFAGPEDFGLLTFKYPNTWSVYIAEDPSVSGNSFMAYLHPMTVPTISSRSARFALIVTIENAAYDKVLDSYRNSIEKGDLKSSPIKVNEHEGTRLDGTLAKDIRGSAVIFRVRDKTITVSSQAETFRADFDALIQTIDFNN